MSLASCLLKPQPRNRLKKLLCVSVGLAMANIAAAAPLQFDLPEQPLAKSILSLAEKTGLTIGGDAKLLKGKIAPKLSGRYEPEQALRKLLMGSGLVLERHDDNSITLLSDQAAQLPVRKNQKLKVVAKPLDGFGGASLLDSAALDSIPAGNGNLSDLLDRLPAVNSSGRGRSSFGAGELTPENISINGARFYQNSFLVNGISINSDLDPGFSGIDAHRIGSNSQGLYTDVNSLASVKVLDHNISAEYGRFVGGVVDAKTKRYEGENSLNLSWRHSSDDLAEFHYSDDQREDFENGGELGRFSATTDIQPKFSKNFYTLSGALGHGENWGSYISISRAESEIPLINQQGRAYSVTEDGKVTVLDFTPKRVLDQTRENDNVTLTTSWRPDDSQRLDLTAFYGRSLGTHQISAIPDSEFDMEHSSIGFGVHYQRSMELGNLELKFDASQMQDERSATGTVYAVITGITPKTTDAAGGFPALEREQTSFTFKPKFEFEAIELAGLEHRFAIGAELGKKTMEETQSEGHSLPVFGCWPECDVDGLDFRVLTRVTPYDMEVDHDQYSLWLQDTVELGRLSLRPGVRLDRDKFIRENTVAPRFSASFDVFDDGNTVINAGANRYYGRSFAELEAQRIRDLARTTTLFPGKPHEFTLPPRTTREELQNLATPYDDEYTLGVNHVWNNWQADLSWVRRNGEDQIVLQDNREAGTKYYSNDGRSRNDRVNLSLTNLADYDFAGASWGVNAKLTWSERESNQTNLFQGSSAVYDQSTGFVFGVSRTDIVYYKGSIIDKAELPVNSFTSPIEAQVDLTTKWQDLNLTMVNQFTWRDEYSSISDSGVYLDPDSGETMRSYEESSFSVSSTWDMKLRWQPQLEAGKPYVQLDIINVLDRANVAKGSGKVVRYDIGRQFWIELGMSF